MDRTYVSYGLRLLADEDIPGLTRSAPASSPDVRIWLNRRPPAARKSQRVRWYQSEHLDPEGNPNLVIWRTVPEGAFHFVYANQTEFFIDPDGAQVWCSGPGAATIADTAVYLRGPILGFVLRLRGVVCLHASAVAVDGSAIALLGDTGAGKSTTAAGFATLGFAVLADDVTALKAENDVFHVLPGYPQLNLWPDAGEALYGKAAILPRLTPAGGINDWWDKRYVELDGQRGFQREPLPLSAVYVLGERTSAEGVTRIQPMPAQDAFMTLIDGTYVNYALDPSMRATEFKTLGELVRTTPIRLVTTQDGADGVLDLCNVILDDYREAC